jgi:FixJ family two-component response regulator
MPRLHPVLYTAHVTQINAHAAANEKAQARFQARPVVLVASSDSAVRNDIEALITRAGWETHALADAGEFLSHSPGTGPACAVLDLDLPGGVELLDLVSHRRDLPVVFMSSAASVRTTVRAMKAGAIEFLTKPCDESLLLDALQQGLSQSSAALAHAARTRVLHDRFGQLSHREREVMDLVVAGRMNKHVAEQLGISEITVKVHRGKVMRKMKAASLPDLVNMVAVLRGKMSHRPADDCARALVCVAPMPGQQAGIGLTCAPRSSPSLPDAPADHAPAAPAHRQAATSRACA